MLPKRRHLGQSPPGLAPSDPKPTRVPGERVDADPRPLSEQMAEGWGTGLKAHLQGLAGPDETDWAHLPCAESQRLDRDRKHT